MNKDYYEILGLPKSATVEEITKAYRRLAMKYHPDRNKDAGAEEKFKEIKEAYEQLSDPKKKAAADQAHSYTYKKRQYEKEKEESDYWYYDFKKDFDTDKYDDYFKTDHDFYKDVFSEFVKRQAQSPITVDLNITLETAYTGKLHKTTKGHTISIPAGVKTGTKIQCGNTYYRIEVTPHTKFKRSDNDLLVEMSINAIEAMLGVDSYLEHLDGKQYQFSVPPGIQHGQVIKLTGKGMIDSKTSKIGDILVRISITIPKTLSILERAALKTVYHRAKIDI
jgi:curved DNA-binding protein